MAASARDLCGGALMLVIGAAAAIVGHGYGMGTLTQMGPGFLPVALGVILAGLGILLLLTALRTRLVPVVADTDWRGVLCILAGMGGFILLGGFAGLIPAALVCVFVAALGDRSATLRSAALLALSITAASVALFSYGLGIRFPLLHLG